ILSGFSSLRCEATVYPSNGTAESVQYFHDTQAQNGDTIVIPAGTFTWTSGVTISKAITLQGAGAMSTIINDNCQNVKLFGIKLVANQLTRITGCTFQNAGRTGSSFAIQVDGSNTDGSKFRFDHNTYTNIAGLFVLNTVIGVIDHNTWTQPGHAGFFIFDGHWNGGGVGKGDESWADSTNFGGSQFLFMEDNTFTGTSPSEVLPLTDAYYGARFVIRHNTIHNMYVANHGTESSGRIRGGRAIEVYNNTYLGTGINRYIVGIRSGTLLVHDNTITGYFGRSATIAFVNYRNLAPFRPWDLGLAGVDGTSQWDNNDPTVYFTGTAASSGSDTVTVNGSPNWTVNRWADYVLRRTTNLGGSGSVTYGWIVSNTANTITYRGTAGFRGRADMTFAPGDSLEIRRVNSALDQPGRARGSLITSDPTPRLPWPAGQNDQVTEPMYFWNNIVTETGQNVSVIENGSGGARQGIRWFNGRPMPGYTPYVYPHPLTTSLNPATLGNISTRCFVQTGDNVMVGGFIVQGTEPKRVIIRAIGPELTQHGVANVLADPTLELHDGTGALIASNYNWQTTHLGGIITANQVSAIRNSGYAPSQASETAIIATLPPGNYTAIVSGVNNTTGVALVDVYDLQ